MKGETFLLLCAYGMSALFLVFCATCYLSADSADSADEAEPALSPAGRALLPHPNTVQPAAGNDDDGAGGGSGEDGGPALRGLSPATAHDTPSTSSATTTPELSLVDADDEFSLLSSSASLLAADPESSSAVEDDDEFAASVVAPSTSSASAFPALRLQADAADSGPANNGTAEAKNEHQHKSNATNKSSNVTHSRSRKRGRPGAKGRGQRRRRSSRQQQQQQQQNTFTEDDTQWPKDDSEFRNHVNPERVRRRTKRQFRHPRPDKLKIPPPEPLQPQPQQQQEPQQTQEPQQIQQTNWRFWEWWSDPPEAEKEEQDAPVPADMRPENHQIERPPPPERGEKPGALRNWEADEPDRPPAGRQNQTQS